MFMRKDITDVNPIIDDSPLYMVNDLIFTSAGELVKVVVEKSGESEWEHGDNVEW